MTEIFRWSTNELSRGSSWKTLLLPLGAHIGMLMAGVEAIVEDWNAALQIGSCILADHKGPSVLGILKCRQAHHRPKRCHKARCLC